VTQHAHIRNTNGKNQCGEHEQIFGPLPGTKLDEVHVQGIGKRTRFFPFGSHVRIGHVHQLTILFLSDKSRGKLLSETVSTSYDSVFIKNAMFDYIERIVLYKALNRGGKPYFRQENGGKRSFYRILSRFYYFCF
jgi:hypothetical protein